MRLVLAGIFNAGGSVQCEQSRLLLSISESNKTGMLLDKIEQVFYNRD